MPTFQDEKVEKAYLKVQRIVEDNNIDVMKLWWDAKKEFSSNRKARS